MARLEGKTAIVTGGARGIGAGIARRLAAEGARVVLTYSASREAAEATVAAIVEAGGSAEAIVADAGDIAATQTAIAQAVDQLGGLDILVHNAGVVDLVPTTEASEETFRHLFGVNVGGVFFGTKAALGGLRDNGRIILISSVAAHSASVPNGAIYGATKAAVTTLARNWAREFGARGILVNAVQPGPIDTDMNTVDGEIAKSVMSTIALGRYGKAHEVAALVAFLASDEASYITGVSIDVDGGLTL